MVSLGVAKSETHGRLPDPDPRPINYTIISVDDHLVEPPDMFEGRLPAKYQDVGPHIELMPMGQPKLDGGRYIEEPGTEGKPIAWWRYEDYEYSVKRLIAAAGYPADEISLDGVTMDDMRPGRWQQPSTWPLWCRKGSFPARISASFKGIPRPGRTFPSTPCRGSSSRRPLRWRIHERDRGRNAG